MSVIVRDTKTKTEAAGRPFFSWKQAKKEEPGLSTKRGYLFWNVDKTISHLYSLGVGEGGFEPPKALLTDLQSAPFGHSGIPPIISYLRRADGRIRTGNLLITNQLLCR